MHGLINRSIQCFLRDTYGADRWRGIALGAGLGFDNFEPMLTYPPDQTDAVLRAAVAVLERPRDALLEDLGTYLVANRNLEAVRRLLRFGGVTFRDFLHSLDDMRGRGQLALPDLDLPELQLTETSPDNFTLLCRFRVQGSGPTGEMISIQLLEARFAEGRRFDLSARIGG